MLTTSAYFGRRSFLIGAAASLSFPVRAGVAGVKLENIVDQLYAAYAALDTEKVLALLTEDCFFEDPTFHLKATGKAEIRKIAEALLGHYSNLKIEIENRIVCRNWVITQQRFAGLSKTSTGEGRQISVRGASIFEFEKERIKRWTDYYDFATFVKQMNAAK